MRKHAYFDNHWGEGWPSPAHIESCLLDPEGRQRFFAVGHEGGTFAVEGLYGTDDLTPLTGRVDATIYMITKPVHGVFLSYQKWDGRIRRKN